jgi:hypothetical protein
MLQMPTEPAGVLLGCPTQSPSLEPTHPLSFVITGLVPVIHVGRAEGQDKIGDDG